MEARDTRWWETHGSEATAKSISNALSVLNKYWDTRRIALSSFARLYGGFSPITMFGPGMDPVAQAGLGQVTGRLTRNVIQSAIDTVQARIASRIHPMVLWLSTNGGYRTRRRAKRLTRFTDALFREQHTETLMPRGFKDGEIFGSGWVVVTLEHGRIKFARILESELRWDEIEARYSEPRQLHRVRPVDRDRLIALWPSKKGIINRADEFLAKDGGVNQLSLSPLVEVRESWRLPDGPESKGRHVISTPDGCLVDEEWEHDWFPVVKMDYITRPIGWTGQGLCEILADTQVAINRHLHAISTSLHLMGTFKIGIDEASHINPNDINNAFGSIFYFRRSGESGGPPVYMSPPAIQPELFEEVNRLEQKAFQLAGVSMMTASGLKTPGVNAAVAMREMVDIENDRFATISANYEAAHVQLGKVAIGLLADAVKRGEVTEYSVQDVGSKRTPAINFKDIDFDDSDFNIQAFPISSLPTDPEGRLQTVQEWVSAGWVDPKSARRLLNFPDIAAWESRQDANTEWIENCLDSIIDDQKYIPPDPEEDDLQEALQLVTQEISLAKLGGLEDEEPEVMTLLRQYRDEVIRQIQMASAPPQPAPGALPGPQAPPASPMGVPAPQPVSELMPVAPQ